MFRAEVDGKTLDFTGAACKGGGGLRGSNFTMRDSDTCSRWQQATGEAFEGPMKGKRLPIVPMRITTWGEWRAQHPDTLALAPVPGLEQQYTFMGQMISNLRRAALPGVQGTENDNARRPLRADSRLRANEQVFGLEIEGKYKAYPLELVRDRGMVNDQIGSTPVLLVHSPAADSVFAFSRSAGGRTLTFRTAQAEGPEIVDAETGSVWTPYGESIRGTLRGTQLDELTAMPSFWFSWAQFFPETEVYR